MGKIKDITGQTFGKLLVMSYVKRHNRRYCVVQCVCGNISEVRYDVLKNGHTTSCGCYAREQSAARLSAQYTILTDQRFGKLVALSKSDERTDQVYWNCLCDCGNKVIVRSDSLVSGNTKSCGCLLVQTARTLLSSRRGSLHYRWNPLLSKTDRLVGRDYEAYKLWRKAVHLRDNYTCQICGQFGGKLNVHHIESYHNNLDLRLAISNGICLCRKHHNLFHKEFGYGNNTRQQFDEFRRKYQRVFR